MAKVRISELLPGDVFELWGHQMKVKEIREGRLFYRYLNHGTHQGGMGMRGGDGESIGSASNQFVNFVRHGYFKSYKSRIEKGQETGDGPDQDLEDPL